ncbi:suppressor of tub2 mutation [Maudiozyma exigua]|uniref:Protein STU1 n=1 Tax=Maudiozyma exigua TaxID=34358 RepID=A0A9P7B2J7_MAUEX|nr:suppressor of tub2 mutation [Kazachstania exigua]
MSTSINTTNNDVQFDSLYTTLNDDQMKVEQKLDLLTQFKGHVKKEFIYVTNIPIYIDALLLIPFKFTHSIDMLFLGHSCLCYLVKRITIQSPESLSQDLISKIINNITELHTLEITHDKSSPHNNKKFWLLTIKILESCFKINPIFLENSIKASLENETIKASNQSNTTRIKVIFFMINELCQIKQFNNQDPLSSLKLLSPIILEFFNDVTDKSMFGDTYKNNINSIIELLSDIFRKYVDQKNFDDFVQRISEESVRTTFTQQYQQQEDETVSGNIFDTAVELQTILQDAKPPHQLSSNNNELSHNTLPYTSLDNLADDLENLLEIFHSPKETEQNWKIRQSNILKIRSMFHLNEKLILEEKVEFVNILKSINFIDCISKSALSLRTTLSLNTSQLIRDIIILLKDNLTISILDHLFLMLKTLLSSTKKLSSQMGYYCLLVMFLNVNFHSKLFNDSFSLVNEKNVILRNTSAILLRIMLIKSNHSSKLEANLVFIEEWLRKGIADSQTQVRESTRVTFWYYYKAYPTNAKNLLNNSFTTQLRKAIELAIPQHLDIDYEKQFQRSVSSSSSKSNSRRSSLLSSHLHTAGSQMRKYPSYAQPTQSSISQKHQLNSSRINRSTSEVLSNTHGSTIAEVVDTKRLKTNEGSTIKRKSSAPVLSKKIQQDQLDLTDELGDARSISLINKYMDITTKETNEPKENKKHEEKNKQLIQLYSLLDNDSQYTEFLMLLQNCLLIPHNSESEQLDFNRILPFIRKIILKAPLRFKSLLTVENFVTHLPYSTVIELYAINNISRKDVINKLENIGAEDMKNKLGHLSGLLEKLAFSTEPSTSIFYMKYRGVIFNFILNLFHDIFSNEHLNQTVTNLTFENVISNIFKIYGNELDNQLYFDVLHVCYLFNKQIFVDSLKKLQFVSVKLKISEELQKRDKTFQLNDVVLSKKEGNNPENVIELGKTTAREDTHQDDNERITSDSGMEENDLDIKKYMEMTMVNPFKQNRSTSGDSVVHNTDLSGVMNTPLDHKIPDQTSMTTVDPRIYEMTKVVSIYQNAEKQSHTTDSPEIKEEDENNGEIGLSDIFQENKKANTPQKLKSKPTKGILNENYVSKPDEVEHTVKFVEQSPEIIGNENTRQLPDEKSSNTSRDISKRIDAPVASVTGITDIKVENLQEHKEISRPHYPILHKFEGSPITLYELAKVISRRKSHTQGNKPDKTNEDDLKQLLKGVNRIKSGTFTIKHLNYLIEPLITFNPGNNTLLNWLETEGGYHELSAISLMLLQSMDDAALIPTTMTRKALLLIQCLFGMKEYTNRMITEFNSNILSGIWDQFTLMVDKLLDFTNEVYLLICETRLTLVRMNYFKTKSITSILSKLVMELPEDVTDDDYRNEFNETKIIGNLVSTNNISYNNIEKLKSKIGLKQSFMISTIVCVLQAKAEDFKTFQLSEIIQTMSFFVRKTNSDWRYNSISVAVEIFKILDRRTDVTKENTDQIFSCLDSETYKLIKIMGESQKL